MSEIKVPQGMLDAAAGATKGITTGQFCCVRDGLESALRWLSENPVCPTREQQEELCHQASLASNEANRMIVWSAATHWPRLMFLAPEPSVAEIDARIPDLLFDYPTHVEVGLANKTIREAFRRGQKEGAK